ncbi:MAG TPA: mannose-1-phosphate guanylyltransferase/mannose-6-phosphate isomerase [Bauldia sp.]|nr:mannose-1-phosphate guanylyltransferase/mannose-6-phosphate isomerase [Bauldia sp.]
MTDKIVPVILSGGAGTRLWPASTEMRPKPFLPLVGGKSTFAGTLTRVSGRDFSPPVIVANKEHRPLVEEALAAAGIEATVLLEPEGRDTAAAIAAAAAWVAREYGEHAVMLVLAADHLIRNTEGFRASVAVAAAAAAGGPIVVFGVEPSVPATSYGYIRPGEPVAGTKDVRRVVAFVEKPDRSTAEHYIESGYLWNSGNFALTAGTALAELRRHVPEVARAAAAAIDAAKVDGHTVSLDREAFARAPRISFDHAVMEKTDRAAVVAAGFDWSDLGTWSSVWDASEKDETGNAVGEAVLVETTGSFVASDGPRVGLVGVENLVVVANNDSVLVAPRERADSVKELVAALNRLPEKNAGDRQRHYRPWGYYQSLDIGETHQVKRIVVKPGARLSLQRHRRRAEHWTVVQGVAEVTVGMSMDSLEVKTVRENETVHIPLHAIHRMANRGETPMTLIEVQYGDYFGEDDIERFEDDYGRVA